VNIAPLILSASSIRSYLTCGHRYYLESVLRIPAPHSMEAVIGIAVHAGAEAHVKSGPEAAGEAMRSSFADWVVSVPPGGEIPALDGLVDAGKLLAMWKKHIAPTLGPMKLVESNFAITVDGTLVTGQIDFADQDVHDTKTTTTLSRFRPDSYRLQLSIYRHGFRALLGEWPRKLILDVLARNGRWKQVEMEHDDRELADAVGVAAAGIMEGRFKPTGATSGACNWCPFSGGRCSYAVITE
jgi:hypothetical protein